MVVPSPAQREAAAMWGRGATAVPAPVASFKKGGTSFKGGSFTDALRGVKASFRRLRKASEDESFVSRNAQLFAEYDSEAPLATKPNKKRASIAMRRGPSNGAMPAATQSEGAPSSHSPPLRGVGFARVAPTSDGTATSDDTSNSTGLMRRLVVGRTARRGEPSTPCGDARGAQERRLSLREQAEALAANDSVDEHDQFEQMLRQREADLVEQRHPGATHTHHAHHTCHIAISPSAPAPAKSPAARVEEHLAMLDVGDEPSGGDEGGEPSFGGSVMAPLGIPMGPGSPPAHQRHADAAKAQTLFEAGAAARR